MENIKTKTMSQESKRRRKSNRHCKMVHSTKANGTSTPIRDMAEVTKFGPTAAFTMAIGNKIRPMVAEDLFTQTETFMMVIGEMTRRMASANTRTPTELSTKDTGKTISNMARAKSSGPMAPSMKANTSMERRTAMDSSAGPTSQATVAILLTTIFMVMERIHGLTVECSMATGTTTKCTGKESSPGQMVGDTKENTFWTRKRATVFSTGRMGASMMGIGKMESKRESVFILTQKPKLDMEDGKMARGRGG